MQDNQRGKNVALGALALQLALVALTVVVWWRTQSLAAMASFWLVLAPVPIWVLTAILFYCRYLQRREATELEQLAARGADSGGIFDEGDEGGSVRTAAARVRWVEKYLAAGFTLALAAYHLAIGTLILRGVTGAERMTPALETAWPFVPVVMAFAAFLMSMYATGMAKSPAWRPLRAPGSYLFANALALFVLAGVLAADHWKWRTPGTVMTYVLPVFMIAVGAEMVLNFVLQIYRPRVPGTEQRFAYDSRMLDLIAQPRSIGHSIAEALNYQFGFEVSSTWFYRLLQRALAPLLVAGAIVVWLLTGVVIVDQGEQYVVLHWGSPRLEMRDGHPRVVTLTPRRAPYLIWPWPIDTARRFDTGKVHEITLGVGRKRGEEEDIRLRNIDGRIRKVRVYLWSQEHGQYEELDTLVAIPPRPGPTGPGATTRPPGAGERPAVALIRLVVGVYYRVTDAGKFGYTFADAPKLLEGVAHREMVRYAASATLDDPVKGPGAANRPQAIMSLGRGKAAADLKRRIAAAVGEFDVGVEIVGVDILACHPPPKAAEAFERVINAERGRERQRYAAEAQANSVLAGVAGDPGRALRLAQAIGFMQRLQELLRVRGTDGDIAGALDARLVQERNEADALDNEVRTERLLGRDTQTTARQLLRHQQTFVAMLEGARADPRKFDFAGRLARARTTVEELFAGVGGQAAVRMAQAWAFRWKNEFEERVRTEAFPAELEAYRKAPELYMLEKRLAVLAQGLRPHRKYVLGFDRGWLEVWLNLESAEQGVGTIEFGQGDEGEEK